MDCPKCNNTMNKLEGFSFSAAKCDSCGGIWFQDGDHELAKDLVNSKEIDNLDTNANAVYDLKRDVDCPECNVKMMKMVDPTQLNIDLESCPDCYGTFFDAGEFADYSEYTLLEKVKNTIDTFKTNIRSA